LIPPTFRALLVCPRSTAYIASFGEKHLGEKNDHDHLQILMVPQLQEQNNDLRPRMILALVDFMKQEGFTVHAARGVDGYKAPSPVRNDGYGKAIDRRPDVVGFDFQNKRIVFGVVREDRQSIDTEDALEEYNVFLDHNALLRDQASILYVMIPEECLQEFTSLITHYIHREYWHRIVPVGWKEK
jgi:hypothetical protein